MSESSSQFDPDNMSLKELRSFLDARQVDYSDCREKMELVERVRDTIAKGISPPAWKPQVKTFTKTIGGLEAIITQNFPTDDEAEIIVVVSHGFGANNLDLSSIGSSVIGVMKKKTQFIFPNGPISLGGGSVAWWHINIEEMLTRVYAGQILQMTAEKPAGIDDSAKSLVSLIKFMKSKSPKATLVLAGFSQGAMLSTHVSLLLEEEFSPHALVIWSGSLINSNEWKELCSKNSHTKKIRVLQSHGTSDPLLPFQVGSLLTQFLKENGMDVSFMSFGGGHTIPNNVITSFVSLLKSF